MHAPDGSPGIGPAGVPASQRPGGVSSRHPAAGGGGGARAGGSGGAIRLEELVAKFTMSFADAAQKLRVSPQTLASVCKAQGISAWPDQALAAIQNRLAGIARESKAAHLPPRCVWVCVGETQRGRACKRARSPSLPSLPSLTSLPFPIHALNHSLVIFACRWTCGLPSASQLGATSRRWTVTASAIRTCDC